MPKQSPNNKILLAKKINTYLEKKDWNYAKLAAESLQSKSTITRIMDYSTDKNKKYHPSMQTIQAIALALKLSPAEAEDLFFTAFPELCIWTEAIENGYSIDTTNELLYKNNLPTLSRTKD